MLAEHARMVEENHNLIYGFLHKYKLSEDFYGDAAIGLCKAAESYDASKGSAFATYAYKCMFNECRKTMREEKHRIKAISYETPVVDGENLNLEHILSDKSATEHMEFISYMKWFVEKMCLLDLQILLYRLQGDSYRKIASKIGYTYQTVKDRLGKIGNAYKAKKRLCAKEDSDDFFERKYVRDKIFVVVGI